MKGKFYLQIIQSDGLDKPECQFCEEDAVTGDILIYFNHYLSCGECLQKAFEMLAEPPCWDQDDPLDDGTSDIELDKHLREKNNLELIDEN